MSASNIVQKTGGRLYSLHSEGIHVWICRFFALFSYFNIVKHTNIAYTHGSKIFYASKGGKGWVHYRGKKSIFTG